MNTRNAAVLGLSSLVAVVIVWFGGKVREQRVWHNLLDRQLATIKRLEEIHPRAGPNANGGALVTPNNVWGNVTYTSDSSGLSIDDMHDLQAELDAILTETTSENSIESVDRVFELMLEFSGKTEFITSYREEFREYDRMIGEQHEPSGPL